MKVIHDKDLPSFYTEEKCFIKEIFNQASSENLSIAKAIVKPGVTTQRHALKDTNEWYYILKGQGLMHVETENKKVFKGTCIYIPTSCTQSITNTGKEDLEILCICTPRFKEDIYVNKETL